GVRRSLHSMRQDRDSAISPDLQALGKVPMIDGAERTYARLEQGIGKAAVIIDPLLIHRPGACSLNSCPRSREAVALLIQALQNGDVFLIAMVLIAGDVSASAPFDFAHSMREAVPIRFAFS